MTPKGQRFRSFGLLLGRAAAKAKRNKAARFGTSGHTIVTLLGTPMRSRNEQLRLPDRAMQATAAPECKAASHSDGFASNS